MVCRCHRPEGPLMMIMGSPLSTEVLPLSLLLAHFLSPPHPISSSTPIPFAFYYLSHPSFSSLFPCPFPFLFSSSFFRFSSFYSLPLEPIFLPSHRMIYVKLTETNGSPGTRSQPQGPPDLPCYLSSCICPPCTSPSRIPFVSHHVHMLLCSCKTEDLCTLSPVPGMPFLHFST